MTFRELRQRAGLTQQELADAIGADQTTISKIEGGKVKDPGYGTVTALARVLGKSPETVARAIAATEAA